MDADAREQLGDRAEAPGHHRESPIGTRKLAPHGNRLGIAIDRDQSTGLAEARQNGTTVPATPEVPST